jgi:hypothetical protein
MAGVSEAAMAGGYPGAVRAIGIALRTAHLFAMAVFAGGVHLGAPAPSIAAWRTATIATGAALLVVELSHSRHWLYQVRGLAALAHVAALALLAYGGMDRSAVAVALVLGGVGSHVPKSVRKFSLRHRRVVD